MGGARSAGRGDSGVGIESFRRERGGYQRGLGRYTCTYTRECVAHTLNVDRHEHAEGEREGEREEGRRDTHAHTHTLTHTHTLVPHTHTHTHTHTHLSHSANGELQGDAPDVHTA